MAVRKPSIHFFPAILAGNNRSLNRTASTPFGWADEASATSSSKESRSGFCDCSAQISACDRGRDFSSATHAENAIPKTRLQCRAILAAAAVFTGVPSNRPSWLRRGAFVRDDLLCDDPATQARRSGRAGGMQTSERLEAERRSTLPDGRLASASLEYPRRFAQNQLLLYQKCLLRFHRTTGASTPFAG